MNPQSQDDTSIATAHATILDALRGAGEMGLLLSDLVEVIGAAGQNKLVIKRLQDLQNRNQVTSLPNSAWKIKDPNDQGETIPGYSCAPGSQGPSVRPSINLPGTPKFSNYKNALQEYCQKCHAAVPSYQSQRGSTGLLGAVTFMANKYEAEVATDNVKEADQRAAFSALKGLGYLKKDAKYLAPVQIIGSKRNSVSSMDCSSTPSKQTCPSGAGGDGSPTVVNKTSKSELNELAQRNKLSQPTYDIVSTSNGFFCTVTFNGRQFKSMKSCSKKKDAEQNAAEVALTFLTNPQTNGFHNASPTETAADVNDMIKIARVASNVMKLSLKNRLQEYCQRLKKALPSYETTTTDEGLYLSKVFVEGQTFDGQPTKGKKDAEKSSAEAALQFLGLMAVENEKKES